MEGQRGHLIFLMSHSFRSRIPELRTQEVQYAGIEHKMVPKKVKCTMGSKGTTQISTFARGISV